MTKRTPTHILERRLKQAKAREAYYENLNSNPDTVKATVDNRPRFRVGYRSLTKTIDTDAGGGTTTTDNARVAVLTSKAAARWFEGVAVGAELTAANTKLGLDYTNVNNYVEVQKFDTSSLHAVIGGSPTVKVTAWGTRNIRYYKTSAGEAQSSYTAPISIRTGPITIAAIIAAAQAIATDKKSVLGEYGRMWYTLENEPTTLDID